MLLAINAYPGLRNLDGPENDIAAFRDWLLDPIGGDVDPANIKVIKSSDYPPVKLPDDANPTELAFKRALNALVRDSNNAWVERAGQRLYLYMAGHGFTAGASLNDPALFSATAQSGDTAHIAGYRYAARIASAGFYDEIVLIMDCCQDVLKASNVLDPSWMPPDRNMSAQVKLFQAYGAPRGQAAFEAGDTAKNVRGFFSKALIEALKSARPDDQGFVTGQTLKNQLLQIWGDGQKAKTGYDPPIRPPDGQDIQLFRRAVTPDGSTSEPVTFSLNAPAPANAELQVLEGGSRTLVASMPASALAVRTLAPGFYKAVLTGTTRSRLFDVDGTKPVQVSL